MQLKITIAFLCLSCVCLAQPDWKQKESKTSTLHYTSTDEAIIPAIEAYLTAGEISITNFFGHPFKQKFDVYIYPNRVALDKQWQKDWGVSDFKSECWMVASGVATKLDILSPNAWATEACEHQASKIHDVQKLITHELVHVFHGQHNPKPTFDGLDNLAWLIEGVAVFASGQLDEKRIEQVKTAIQSGKAPSQLDQFWTGPARYGQAGSIISYLDKKSGRENLYKWLSEINQESILTSLGKSEEELIADWKLSMK